MTTTSESLRTYVERIERIHDERDALSEDLSDLYTEASDNGFDKRALKSVIAWRRKDRKQAEEQQALFESYLAAVEGRTALPSAAEGSATSPAPAEKRMEDPKPAPPVSELPDGAGDGSHPLDIPAALRRELVTKVAEASA